MQSNTQIYNQFLKLNRQWIDNSIISDSRWRSPTNKPVWADYSSDQKKFTGHMFNIKLEEKSCKMSFKALLVKIQRSKNRQGRGKREMCPPPTGADRVNNFIYLPNYASMYSLSNIFKSLPSYFCKCCKSRINRSN